ncbi:MULTISPECIES: TrkH family potassium uptake protein [unclassified Streptomyces]|uniref:TrkH family potassium uptake protein n=1 Tax=unclassified Streptomyces TaxID=2593676 RepID=UPI0022B6A09B|nr:MULTISPECIES: potassium transporter TrkG [unclassified Streptomyces]MCZ7415417.1 TrkH family potassium uptake protein [Streptomyces sp. WMMC897]MCZ7417849.1 TrkH family potassium uptake protein [Streptomyces sp. WMMC897]MCZ7417875.1 TrkH family potassium uptake protein [Streptomyces sp. WMMC897]MCZ7432346.1 TrkH family potassium uptake protein [Streptomyces sp. WMMC1477]
MVTRRRPGHPAQVVVAAFATAVAAGTVLLMLPAAKAEPGGGAPVLEALFTSTSAVCVTGLIVVDTPAYWSGFGQAVILGLIQVGGFGIMTSASLLVMLLSRRLNLRARLTAASETKALGLGEVRSVVLNVAKVSLVLEAVTAAVLIPRYRFGYDEPWPEALWLGGFHAVSAFNNAGFALYSDSLVGFVTDPWICLPVALAVVAGGLGFPVLFELRRRWRRPRGWSLHTKIVLWASGAFLLGGTAFVTAVEWNNPATLGPLEWDGKLLAGFFQGVMPRSGGFSTVDTGEMNPASWVGIDVLMFVGGASAGTAGGIKVTTFAVLFYVIYAEIRGDTGVNILNRRLSGEVQRQALTVALLSVAAVVVSTVVFIVFTDINLDQSLFEVVSAFATVGLSTGVTAQLPPVEQVLLVVLMFVGRLGPITVASALALRQRVRMYELPEERPVIG